MPDEKNYPLYKDILILRDVFKEHGGYAEFDDFIEKHYDLTSVGVEDLYKNTQKKLIKSVEDLRRREKQRFEYKITKFKNSMNTIIVKEFRPLFSGDVQFSYKSHEDLISSLPEKVYHWDSTTKDILEWDLSVKLRALLKSKCNLRQSYLAKEEWLERTCIGESTNNKYASVKMRLYTEHRRLAINIDGVWYYNE